MRDSDEPSAQSAHEAQSAQDAQEATPKRAWRGRLRLAFFLGLVVFVYFAILRRYSIVRLEIATANAMAPAMPRGALYLIDRDPARALARDWIVMWKWRDGTLFSRVRGLPGDRMLRRKQRWLLRTPDGAELGIAPEYSFAAEWDGRQLAANEYLLLNDQPASKWADSRGFGPVARELVLARIVMPLGGGRE